jgi:hypothetical protein
MESLKAKMALGPTDFATLRYESQSRGWYYIHAFTTILNYLIPTTPQRGIDYGIGRYYVGTAHTCENLTRSPRDVKHAML